MPTRLSGMSTVGSGLSPALLRTRLERARSAAAKVGVDALLIAPGSDLRYLLGGSGTSFERLTCLVLPADGAPVLVVPKLEAPGYAAVAFDVVEVDVATWVDGEDPYAVVARRLGRPGRVAGGDMMPALHLLGVRAAMPGA